MFVKFLKISFTFGAALFTVRSNNLNTAIFTRTRLFTRLIHVVLFKALEVLLLFFLLFLLFCLFLLLPLLVATTTIRIILAAVLQFSLPLLVRETQHLVPP